MYRAEVASVNRGDPYWKSVAIGLTTFGASFAGGLITVPGLGSVGSAMVTGAATSGATEVTIQALDQQGIDPNKVAVQAAKGSMISTIGANAGTVGYAAGLTTEAASVTTAVTTVVVEEAMRNSEQTQTTTQDKKQP